MPVYIGLLRGINIGPHKRMKMEKLRSSCEALGFRRVQTYIQSGNLVFQTSGFSDSAVRKKLEDRILSDFGFSSTVILRTREEVGQIIQGNPLENEPGVDASKLHVVFLSATPLPANLKQLESLTLAPDKVRHRGKEIYFFFPNGVSGSSIWKYSLDRVLTVAGTMRNWKTVNMLYEIAVDCG
jgi:uncharacterized protein (DUF1697 family)